MPAIPTGIQPQYRSRITMFSQLRLRRFLYLPLGVPLLASAIWLPLARAATPVTMTEYTSRSQAIGWGQRSHWKQPWRSYMDTVPATTLLNAVGINFNVTQGQASATAKLLANSGFKRARIEIGWNSLSYTDPNQLVKAKREGLETILTTLHENGIRPLILLNANSGEPCPILHETVELTAAASEGATEVQINPQDISKVVPGRSGFSTTKIAARSIITSVDSDGTAKLSRPLIEALPAGQKKIATLLYEPFRPATLEDGSSNPKFERTMQGWLNYV
ncbi:MAG: hypothetical protein ACRDK7_10245, partial [Solirubrobacteraceae bacterium]